jgi:hypothetical protein
MKKLAMCLGVLFAVAANASLSSRAALVGQHTVASSAGGSALICEYAGARAKFEILAQHGNCAAYIDVQ